ncbi:MAG: iron-containing alcohol dehydrogenase [Lachnospiraceae bacterium]|nr:iron-containing alcohol dehydrogenase [Lachnospiraceae bacterium]
MNFFIPTQIFNETDCVAKHASIFANAGQKALLITGRSSAVKTGALTHVTDALTSQGITWCLFDQIEENPSVETVVAAADFGKAEGADFVIGIGGGSPLDASKAIALLMANPDCGREILYKKATLSHLPVYAVPTTAGTGSEATPYAILTLHDAKTKRGIAHRIFPVAALVDPTYLTIAPQPVLHNTAVDAFGHLVESYFNRGTTLYNQMLCEYALKLWGDAAPALVAAAKENIALSGTTYVLLSNASTMAGMAISHTGTSIPHGLSYFLTYEHGIAHGKAVGTFLVPYLRAYPNQDEVAYFLTLLGIDTLDELEALLLALIGTVTVTDEDRSRYITSMLSNQAKLANCPYTVTEELLRTYFANNALIA